MLLCIGDLFREFFRLPYACLAAMSHAEACFLIEVNARGDHAPCTGAGVRAEGKLFVDGANCNEIYFAGEDATRSPHVYLSCWREEKLRVREKKVGEVDHQAVMTLS